MSLIKEWTTPFEEDDLNYSKVEETDGTVAIAVDQKKTGARSLKLTGAATGAYAEIWDIVSPRDEVWGHFHWLFNSVSAENEMLRIRNRANADYIKLNHDVSLGSHYIYVYDHNGDKVDTIGPYATNTFHCVEIHLKASSTYGSSSDGEIHVWVNDVAETVITNSDYVRSVNELRFYNGTKDNGADYWFDNCCWCDADSPGPNGRFSETLIESSVPTGDGNYSEFEPSAAVDHWTLVDETPPDAGTTYNIADANNEKETYTFDAPTYGGAIRCVVYDYCIYRTGSLAHADVQTLIRYDGTDYLDENPHYYNGAYFGMTQPYVLAPDSSAWSNAKIGVTEAGHKALTNHDVDNTSRVTGVRLLVLYAPYVAPDFTPQVMIF